MVMLRRLKIIVVAFVVTLVSSLLVLGSQSLHASALCNSEECQAAAAREAEARQRAAEASSAAESLEQVIQGIELEIYAIEAKIASNEAIAADLALKIKTNEEKLEIQKSALASLLVDNYFDAEPETIMILAGSSSISDLAERQTRAETIKQQINLSAKNVKAVKEELEGQKAEVDRLLVDQNNQRDIIKQRRAEQNRLMEQYRNNAEAYTEEAEAARKEKEQKIAEEVAARNGSGVAALGVNTYPYQGQCPANNLRWWDAWGYVCQCVHYAAYKATEHWGVDISYWGNANMWDEAAVARGYVVDRNPAPFTVAVDNGGSVGHVMWIEGVNADGSLNLSEYNNYGSSFSHLPGDYGYRIGASSYGLVFIHFDQRAW